MDKLVKEGVLLKTGTDAYSKVNQKVLIFWLVKILLIGYLLGSFFFSFITHQTLEYEFTVVKDEIDGDKAPQVEDLVYMKVSFLLNLIVWINEDPVVTSIYHSKELTIWIDMYMLHWTVHLVFFWT